MILNTVTWGSGGGADDLFSDLQTAWWSSKSAIVTSSNLRPLALGYLQASDSDQIASVMSQMQNISITFPNLTSIPGGFFFDSIQPMGMPMSEMFPNVTVIGSYAFCTGSVTNQYTTTAQLKTLSRSSVRAFYSDILTNFSKVTIIGEYAFTREFAGDLRGSAMSPISFPEAVTIGDYAFATLSNMTPAYKSQITLSVYGPTTTNKRYRLIGRPAISLPKAVDIGDGAFLGATDYTQLYLPECTRIGMGGFGTNTSVQTVSIPKCTSIGNYAFAFCSSMVSISASLLQYVGVSAFYECLSLTNVYFPECQSIQSGTFGQCKQLLTVSMPLVSVIGTSAFYSCYSLTTVSFPACTSIGSEAFQYCSALINTYFPNVTRIYPGAFSRCIALTNIIFPKCTQIDASVFSYCTSLTTVSFPACTQIGSRAFYQCSYLDAAYFYWTGTNSSIYSSAFYSCWRLRSLYLLGSQVKPLQYTSVFAYTPISTYTTQLGTNGSIFVPASLLTSYKAAANWSVYSARFVGLTDAEVSAIKAQMGL